MNSRQWFWTTSFLGPTGLASSSMTPPASSKTFTILYTWPAERIKKLIEQTRYSVTFMTFLNMFSKYYLFYILKSLQWSCLALWIHGCWFLVFLFLILLFTEDLWGDYCILLTQGMIFTMLLEDWANVYNLQQISICKLQHILSNISKEMLENACFSPLHLPLL